MRNILGLLLPKTHDSDEHRLVRMTEPLVANQIRRSTPARCRINRLGQPKCRIKGENQHIDIRPS